jgi:hypothetical protein
MNYFNNNPALKVEVTNANLAVTKAMNAEQEKKSLADPEPLLSEEDCIKYVEMSTKKMIDCFREAIKRHDRRYNFDKVCQDDLIRSYDEIEYEHSGVTRERIERALVELNM